MRSSSRLALPLLLLALGVAPACKGVPQPPQVETAGLRIDVEKARQKRGVVVELRIWNDFEEKVSFDHGNVRLMYGDREVSAKAYRRWGRGRTPVVQPKSNQDFRWVFETGETLDPGSYTVEIRDLMLDEVPAGDTAVFTINL